MSIILECVRSRTEQKNQIPFFRLGHRRRPVVVPVRSFQQRPKKPLAQRWFVQWFRAVGNDQPDQVHYWNRKVKQAS